MLAIVEIPEHCFGVSSPGSAERTVGRHSDGIQISGVTNVVGLEPTVGQVPDLQLIENEN